MCPLNHCIVVSPYNSLQFHSQISALTESAIPIVFSLILICL